MTLVTATLLARSCRNALLMVHGANPETRIRIAITPTR